MNKTAIRFVTMFHYLIDDMQEMHKRFKDKTEAARQLYWNATILPRKAKKAVRKQALADFRFYTALTNEPMFTF